MPAMFIERTLARDLMLPDGRNAETLRLLELRRVLERLKIPVEPTMTKDQMLECYRLAFVPALAEVRRNLPIGEAAGCGREFNKKLLALAAARLAGA